MAALNETVRGRIAGYDERSNEVIIRAPYTDFATMCRREYKEVEIRLIDEAHKGDILLKNDPFPL